MLREIPYLKTASRLLTSESESSFDDDAASSASLEEFLNTASWRIPFTTTLATMRAASTTAACAATSRATAACAALSIAFARASTAVAAAAFGVACFTSATFSYPA